MIWEKIQNQHSPLQEYRLSGTESTLILKYNPLHRSARITIENQHRLILLEGMNSITGKIIIRNQYDMQAGLLTYDKFNQNEGNIQLDGKRYIFNLATPGHLAVYNKENGELLTDSVLSQPSDQLDGQYSPVDKACFIIGLCWKLSLQLRNEIGVAYANAS
jgi:hypothetical protein